jgi:hypothetical protein
VVGGALGMAVLATVAGLACLRPSTFRDAYKKRPLFIGLLLILLAWTALSSLWSVYPGAEAQALKLTALILAGFGLVAVASGPGARLMVAGAAAAAVVSCALVAIEAATPFLFNRAAQPGIDPRELIRHLSRAGAFLATTLWGAAAAFLAMPGRIWRLAGMALLAVGGVLSAQFGAAANLVAFALGLCAFAAGYAAPRLALTAMSVALAGWVLLAPMLTPLVSGNAALVESLPFSWASRAAIWGYTIDHIWTAPQALWSPSHAGALTQPAPRRHSAAPRLTAVRAGPPHGA